MATENRISSWFLLTVELQWLEHRWLVYHGCFELVLESHTCRFRIIYGDFQFFCSGLGLPSRRPKLSYQNSTLAKIFTEKKRVKVRSTACHYATNKRAMMALGRSPKYHWNQIISKSVHRFSRSHLKLFSIYSPGGPFVQLSGTV